MNAGQASSTINNYYLAPPSATLDAIRAIETKLQTNSESLEFTRKELSLLAQALKDLNERTSGIEKLPDGRTKMGGFVSGMPNVVVERAKVAVTNYVAQKYSAAFYHATNAINAFENSPDGAFTTEHTLVPEFLSDLYSIAGDSAAQMTDFKSALELGEKSLQYRDSVEKRLFVAAQMWNVKRRDDALVCLTNAMAKYPNDTRPPAINEFMLLVKSGVIPIPLAK